MYSYIKGVVTKLNPKFIVVENNGIGYQIITANPYNFKLNENQTIYVHQYVREDVIELYGFKAEDEKELFLKLISVNGIGPKSALSILGSGTVSEVISAIESRNDNYLKKFPGIGSKSAQQIILDLKGKVSFDEFKVVSTTKSDTLVEALVSLGYTKKEATKVISKLDLTKSEGELIKDALRLLSA